VIQGDSRNELAKFPEDSFSFVVTSPPYWSVLNKQADHKVKRERISRDLPTRYSDHEDDLANIDSYGDFLGALATVFRECRRVLSPNRYIAVVVSDFRDKDHFYLFHADIARLLEQVGFSLAGITILVQDSKNLYPYGMPHAFVSNIHHQYVVLARRKSQKSRKKPGGS
jgi:DNA modification methylase